MKKYLIVKTGKKGATINQLYAAQPLSINAQRVRITGNFRLAGDDYQGIVRAVKQAGHTGTFAVFEHEPADADALMRSSNKTLLALTAGLRWDIVGTLQAESREALSKEVYDDQRQAFWDQLEAEGLIQLKGSGCYTILGVPDETKVGRWARNEYIKHKNAEIRDLRYDFAAKIMSNKITYRITDTVRETPTTYSSLFETETI